MTKDIKLRELNAAVHLHRGVSLVPSIPADRRLQKVQRMPKTPKVKTLKSSSLEVGHGIAKALYLHCTNLNKSSTSLTMGRCRQRNFIPLPLSPRLLDDNYNVFIYLTEERIREEIKDCLQKVFFGFVWKDSGIMKTKDFSRNAAVS